MNAFLFLAGLALVFIAAGIAVFLNNISAPSFESGELVKAIFPGLDVEGQLMSHRAEQEGWRCPNCCKANAPFVRQCDCPPDAGTIATTDLSFKTEATHFK